MNAKAAEATWKARAGARVSAAQAADVGPAIGRLVEQDNATADALVKLASNSRSKAHRHFEWDDEAAAHQHRLTRAREYLRGIVCVRVLFEKGRPAGEERVRLVHDPDPSDERPRYREASSLADEQDLAARVIGEAMSGLQAWANRYHWLSSIQGDNESLRLIRKVQALLL